MDSFIVRRSARPARWLLVCCPHAGAGPSVFRGWADDLGDVDVAAINLPGREGRFRDQPLRRIDDVLDMFGPALVPLLDRPFAVFGHSLGGLVGYELTRWLGRHGLPQPAVLFVSAVAPPHRLTGERTFDAPQEQFLTVLRTLGGVPEEFFENPWLLAATVRVMRADLELFETYRDRDRQPLGCAIDAMYGAGDARAPGAAVLDWARYTTGRFDVTELPGGHFYVTGERDRLLRHIRRRLDDCRALPG